MSSRHWLVRRLLPILLLILGLAFAVVRQGFLPANWSPLPAIDLAQPDAWFVDWRLAQLKSNAELCGRVLRQPWVEAQLIPDADMKDGCGWASGVRLSAAGHARLHVDKVTCEMAAALSLWLAHDVQPEAQRLFGARVTSVQHFGSYACRNIQGNPKWAEMRSEHARANALDVSGLTLANGRQISVLRDWPRDGPEAQFLRNIHAKACRYFRVAIGPDYNDAHRNHFHFDRGVFSACK
jgi:hypothetical protein